MHRRTFLSASVAAGLAGSSASARPAGIDYRGRLTVDLPTPALLVHLDAFEANLRTLAEHCKRAGCGFRPHAKTHKCPEIARRQVASGALGVCVATVAEAEAMVAAGIGGVVLTSLIVEPGKISRMVNLVQKGDEVLLSLGHRHEAVILQEAAQARRVTIDVLVDVDVGDRRTGILPGEPALELGRFIARCKNLRLRGVQAYAGLASHVVGFERREKISREAMGHAVATRELFLKHDLPGTILSGGSTGTYNIDSAIRGLTELQAGSYVFMDVDYRRIAARTNQTVYTDFQPSLFVLSTVVSATHADRVTIDAGTKALDTTVTFRPELQGWTGLTYQRGGDEFGILAAEPGAKLPRLGDRLEFLVPHCDPTVNLYDRIFAVRGDRVEDVWPLATRGR